MGYDTWSAEAGGTAESSQEPAESSQEPAESSQEPLSHPDVSGRGAGETPR